MNSTKILIVEDEKDIRCSLSELLREACYQTIEATNGRSALDIFSPDISLVILDVMLPDMSGFDVCAAIREKSTAPVLFLTAMGSEADIIHGFEVGGDDYLKKPFLAGELMARIHSLFRRSQFYNTASHEVKATCLSCGSLKLSLDRNHCENNGQNVQLTDTEYCILRLLLERKGDPLSPRYIYEQVWNEPFLDNSSNTVMVHIRSLRKKLEMDPHHPKLIQTAWAKGYMISKKEKA